MEWRNGRRWAGRWVDSTMVKAEGRYLDAGEVFSFSSSDCGNSGGAAGGAELASLVPVPVPPASGGGSGGMEATSVEASSEGGAASP